jgi:hypothetical protein
MTFPQGTKPRLIQVALAEVGTAETGNNETKYGKFMNADKLPWCGSVSQIGVHDHSWRQSAKCSQHPCWS